MVGLPSSISSIADTSTALYRRRAIESGFVHYSLMKDQLWRVRIEEAVQRDGRSMRDISLAAGLSHGYLHGILRDGKEPTLDRFVRICKELRLSLSYALMGADLSPEMEQIVEAIGDDERTRDAVLALLGRTAA